MTRASNAKKRESDANDLRVADRIGAQAHINNTHARLENFDRDYVEFGGFFGPHNPHVFAAAPLLFAACKQWLAGYDGWSDGELKRRADPATVAIIRQTRAAVAMAEREL